MRSFFSIALLETLRIWRSGAGVALLAVTLGWVALVPRFIKGDGTADGAREISLRYSLGGASVICLVALAASGASSLSREREEKRLALTLLRPVAFANVALGRIFALGATGAVVLGCACLFVAARGGNAPNCSHVLAPIMESAHDEALKMYDVFMADPETPPEAKKAKKSVVLRLLEQRAVDNYLSVGARETVALRFKSVEKGRLAVRLRCTNDFDVRDDLRATFSFGEYSGVASNMTQSVVIAPLARGNDAKRTQEDGAAEGERALLFRNDGANPLMFRPRRDFHLLIEADSFGANLFRAWMELVSILILAVAFAVFLGAGLGRSVALFTCLSFIFASAVSSDIIEQYPDQLETDRTDRVGLAITRAVQFLSSPVASLRPLAALSQDECIEKREAVAAFAADALALPLLLAALSALVLKAKKED